MFFLFSLNGLSGLLVFFLEIVVFKRFVIHYSLNVLFPFVFGFAEFINAFSERAKKFGYFLGSKKKEHDQKDQYDFSTAKVSNEGEGRGNSCGHK